MHNAHIDCDGIPEYINTLEEGMDKAERAGAPISTNMLVIIATKAMLTTEQYPLPWQQLMGVEIYSDREASVTTFIAHPNVEWTAVVY